MSSNQYRMGMGGRGRSRKNRKCVKWNIHEINLELGEGMKINEIMDMEYLAVIGIFSRKRMMHETLKG